MWDYIETVSVLRSKLASALELIKVGMDEYNEVHAKLNEPRIITFYNLDNGETKSYDVAYEKRRRAITRPWWSIR